MSSVARFSLVALDCPDPRALAEFYAALTGWPIDEDSSEEWVELVSAGGPTLAFQRAPAHEAPSWPDGAPQQAHLDFDVPDLDTGEAHVLDIGATKTDVQPKPDRWRVFLDPAGHPFCLVIDEGTGD